VGEGAPLSEGGVVAEGGPAVPVAARQGVGELLPLALAQGEALRDAAGDALALGEARALTEDGAEAGGDAERAGEGESRGERLAESEGLGVRDTVGEGSGEIDTPGERLVDAVALWEREAPGERLAVTVPAGDAEARGEAVLSASVLVPTGVTEPEREEDALPRPLLLCEGLPLSLPRVGVGAPEGEPRPLTVPLSVRVDEGDSGGTRVNVTTVLEVGTREVEGAPLAEAAEAEGDAEG
jgi:hypothetical protein